MNTKTHLDRPSDGLSEAVYAFAASPAQQRLWLVDQISQDKAAYNVSEALEMLGSLDPSLDWESLNAKQLNILIISGTHDTIFNEPHVYTLADLIRGTIENAWDAKKCCEKS